MFSLLKSRSDLLNRRAILIGNKELVVYHWYRNELTDNTYLFEINEAGRKQFSRYLQQTPNTPAYILLDIEEVFRVNTIPHVFGADRRALIERRQSRLFRNATYTYAEIQGREKQGRRDDLVLFSALSSDNVLKPWITALEQYKIPLSGVISVPFLLASFLKYMPNPGHHTLVVNIQNISGLRQTFFKKKKLKLSRLTPLPRYDANTYAKQILEETDKIRRYLYSLQLVAAEQPLDIYCLANSDTLSALALHDKNTATTRYHPLDLAKMAHEVGMQRILTLPFSDQLFAYHLLKNTPTPNAYASPHELRYSKLRRFRYALNTVSLLTLLASTVYGGINILDAVMLSRKSLIAQQETTRYQERYDTERRHLTTTPVKPQQLKAAITTLEQIKVYRTTPVIMMQFIGNTLSSFPKIQLKKIEWWGNDKEGTTYTEVTDSEVVDTRQDDSKSYQAAHITAHIVPFDGNYRAAIGMIDRFVSALQEKSMAHKVVIVSSPLDVDPKTHLQGSLQQKNKQAEFVIRAVIGTKDEEKK